MTRPPATLREFVRDVYSGLLTPAQEARVLAVLEPVRELIGGLVKSWPRTLRPWRDHRNNIWRVLVLNTELDAAVKAAIGFRDKWRPDEEPQLYAYYLGESVT